MKYIFWPFVVKILALSLFEIEQWKRHKYFGVLKYKFWGLSFMELTQDWLLFKYQKGKLKD